MITIRKLSGLPNETRHRKLVRLLMQLEHYLAAENPESSAARRLGAEPVRGPAGEGQRHPAVPAGGSRPYWLDLTRLVCADPVLPERVTDHAERLVRMLAGAEPGGGEGSQLLFAVSDLRHALQQFVGIEAADWDLAAPAGITTGHAEGNAPLAGAALYLERVRAPFNLGAVFRTAAAFGLGELLLSPESADPSHPRAKRAAMGAGEMLPWRRLPLESLEGPVFALETGGTPINRFRFPTRATALVGSEELGLSPAGLKLADESAGRVSIPAPGPKRSLNLAVATGILLYCWHAALAAERG